MGLGEMSVRDLSIDLPMPKYVRTNHEFINSMHLILCIWYRLTWNLQAMQICMQIKNDDFSWCLTLEEQTSYSIQFAYQQNKLLPCKSLNNWLLNTRGDLRISLEHFIPNLRIWQFNSRIMNNLKESNGLRLFWTWHRFGFYIWWTPFFVFFKVTFWFLTAVKNFAWIRRLPYFEDSIGKKIIQVVLSFPKISFLTISVLRFLIRSHGSFNSLKYGKLA